MGAYENQEVTGTNETLVENDGILTLAPNPAKGNATMATIDNNWTGDLQVQLTNAKGQVVSKMQVHKTNTAFGFELPLHDVGIGIYQISISNGDEMVVGRLVRL